MSDADDPIIDANVAAITAPIQQLVTQFLANSNIADATTSIKEVIKASATANAAAIGAIGVSATDVAASAKVTADAKTTRVNTPQIPLYPGAHDAENIID